MVSFSTLDVWIILLFFAVLVIIGIIPRKAEKGNTEEYLLSGRKVGLFVFILTNVATWYGGILGVGEFSYRYGLLSWFTQGLPYYIFAAVFALLFARKIREASLFTIPDKLQEVYGKKVGLLASVIIFILVSPAPYLLMTANLLQLIFGIGKFYSLVIGLILSSIYLFRSGYKSYLYTDVYQFFIMFIGFGIMVYFASSNLGDFSYLKANLPPEHLSITGGASPVYIIVWFLIALWTFTDPGFHQRCYAAKTGNIAVKGLLISIALWAVFDFLTTSTGLYARALLPDLKNPVLSFPMIAESILGSGWKGVFYAALFATILSTLNSFIFLSATTLGRDFFFRLSKEKDESKIPFYTQAGLLISAAIALFIAYEMESVIEIWYLIGSICIPGIILLIGGAYYEKFRVGEKTAIAEIGGGIIISVFWLIVKNNLKPDPPLNEIEPMLAGLVFVIIIHAVSIYRRKKISFSEVKA